MYHHAQPRDLLVSEGSKFMVCGLQGSNDVAEWPSGRNCSTKGNRNRKGNGQGKEYILLGQGASEPPLSNRLHLLTANSAMNSHLIFISKVHLWSSYLWKAYVLTIDLCGIF